ncbi:nucleoside-diphosphate kinase [Microdochium nivale]|nr:nucleoside-diphosphate kinase [Microdochium nivale]
MAEPIEASQANRGGNLPPRKGDHRQQQQQPRQQLLQMPRHPALYVAALLIFLMLIPANIELFLRPRSSTSTSTQSYSFSTPIQESIPQINKMATEQTFIAIKPDGVQRGLVGPIIQRFEQRGFKLAAIKLVTPGKAHLEQHYADLKDKPFFAGLVEYMNSGPICAMVWEGLDAVKTGRVLLGATNPLASAPGTIRGDYSLAVGRNVCHGSDSVENAKKEIALWFKDGEVVSWNSHSTPWLYE